MSSTAFTDSTESFYRERDFKKFRRRHALWFGLPSIILATFGISAIYLARSDSSSLESRYLQLAQQIGEERQQVQKEFSDQVNRIRRESQTAAEQQEQLELLKSVQEKEYQDLLQTEKLYLEKLIKLNPNEDKYLYQLALACFAENEQASAFRGRAIMEQLAPLADAGYAPAHLWWASQLQLVISSGRLEKQQALEQANVAMIHIGHHLKRDPQSKAALELKGGLAVFLDRWFDARDAYAQLFETEPFYFVNLVEANNRINRSEANQNILLTARNRLLSNLREPMEVDRWVKTVELLALCYRRLNDFQTGINRFDQEKSWILSNDSGDSLGKGFMLDQLISGLYIGWQEYAYQDRKEFTEQDFNLIKEAFQRNPKSPVVLQKLTNMGLFGKESIAAKAMELYDPGQDGDPPHQVLTELGTKALSNDDFDKAVRYFEQARQKNPKNPQLLNNLAYAYLKMTPPSPERALKLVNDAILVASQSPLANSVLTFFYDTKGTALMELGRYEEAIASLELALRDRPNNRKTIEALIECYQASGLDPGRYRERLGNLAD